VDLDSCLAAIKSPGVVAFPTDTFFALSCDPLEPAALAALRALKGLDSDRPLPLLVPRDYDLSAHGAVISDAAAQLTDTFWPGKLTVIVPCSGELSRAAGRSSDGAVGFRVPDGAWLLELLERFRAPLVGTSANPTGEPPASQASQVREYFGDQIAWIGEDDAEGGKPSTVVDLTGDRPEIIRAGAIDPDEILRCLTSGSMS